MDNLNNNYSMSKSFHDFGNSERTAGTFLAAHAPLISAKLRKDREEKMKSTRRERVEEEQEKRVAEWRLALEREETRRRQADAERERRVRELREREAARRRLFDERRAELERREDERRQKILQKLTSPHARSSLGDGANGSGICGGKRPTSAYAFGSSTPRTLTYLTPNSTHKPSLTPNGQAHNEGGGGGSLAPDTPTSSANRHESPLRGENSASHLGGSSRRPTSAKAPLNNFALMSASLHIPAAHAQPVIVKQKFPLRSVASKRLSSANSVGQQEKQNGPPMMTPKGGTGLKAKEKNSTFTNGGSCLSARMTRSFVAGQQQRKSIDEDQISSSATLNDQRRSAARDNKNPTVASKNQKHLLSAQKDHSSSSKKKPDSKISSENAKKIEEENLKLTELEEKRRQEEELEIELKLEQEREREEEARLKLEEQEELIRMEQARLADEERLRLAIEAEQKRKADEQTRQEEARRKQLEAEAKLRETQERLERERREADERARKEEEERLERKKKLEAIMQRTRQSAGGNRSPLPSSHALNGHHHENNMHGDGNRSPTSATSDISGAMTSSAHHTSSAAALLQKYAMSSGSSASATTDIGRSVENILAKVRSASALNRSQLNNGPPSTAVRSSIVNPTVVVPGQILSNVPATATAHHSMTSQKYNYSTPQSSSQSTFGLFSEQDDEQSPNTATTEYDVDVTSQTSYSRRADILQRPANA